MLVHYQSHLIATKIFPRDTDTLRFNSMTRKDCISLLSHPDSIALIASIGGMTAAPPVNTGIAENFKVA